MEKIMPDLFVVMSDEELKEAIEYASSLGAKHAHILSAMNYDLIINGENMEEYSNSSGKWFPDFVDYINIKTLNDEIGILLSPTVWNTYNSELLYKTLREYGFSFDLEYDPIFIQPKSLMDKIESEKLKSLKNPINSPWTARDIEVVKTAISSIRDIKKATILTNANFNIAIYVNDFNNTVDEFLIASEVAKKKYVEMYKYPNILHLESIDGVFNVFMGDDICVKKVLNMVEEKGIDTIIKPYEDRDKDLLLYDSKEVELKIS